MGLLIAQVACCRMLQGRAPGPCAPFATRDSASFLWADFRDLDIFSFGPRGRGPKVDFLDLLKIDWPGGQNVRTPHRSRLHPFFRPNRPSGAKIRFWGPIYLIYSLYIGSLYNPLKGCPISHFLICEVRPVNQPGTPMLLRLAVPPCFSCLSFSLQLCWAT